MVRLKIGQTNQERATFFPIPFVLFCVFGCRNWCWLAATDFPPWDIRSSYPYFADDQPNVGIFCLISDTNQVLLSLILDYVETNQPLRNLWNIIIIKVKQHGWRHAWLNRHGLCVFFFFFKRLFNLEPKIHCYYTDDFACLCPQFLQTDLYRYCSLIFETVCIRITVILIIRFVFQEAFKLMFVFGKYSFHSFTTVETSAHFSSMSAIISWCVPLIVFQLCGCFQELLVVV